MLCSTFVFVLQLTGRMQKISLQEAFITAFSKLDKLKDDASFGAWLKRIVVNTTISSLRKKNPVYLELDNEIQYNEEVEDVDERMELT